MNSFIKNADVSRRGFLAGTTGLAFAISVGGWLTAKSDAVYAASGRSDITAWVKIGTDNSILIYAPAAEMGQGVNTSLPQIIAEELDADWSKVVVEQSPHDAKTYGNPGFGGGLTTVASKSVNGYHDKLRLAGAQARRVLMDAAAAKWGVPVAELTTQPSMVVHAKSNRKMSYGEIAGFAKMPDALPEITLADLKKPANYRIVGKNVARVDMKDKATGRYEYGMDVQVPGMLYASVARTPVEGGTVESVKDEAAKKVPGVVGVIALKDAVGVIGSSVEATKKAKALLEIKWAQGKLAGFDSGKSMADYQKRATDLGDKGLVYNQIGDAPAAMKGAPTDGSVILLTPGVSTIEQIATRKSMPFDLNTDLLPVTLAGTVATVYAVSSAINASTLAEYVAWLKKNPKGASFGTAAMGSTTHFFGVELGQALGIVLEPVPYKGTFRSPQVGQIPLKSIA